jgi:hypothetical protein
MHVGTVTDSGLKILAEKLVGNKGLEILQFEETEDHQKYWTVEAMRGFANLLKTSTNLIAVEAKFRKANKESEAAQNFLEEVQFYTDRKSSEIKKAQHAEERMRSCDTEAMF